MKSDKYFAVSSLNSVRNKTIIGLKLNQYDKNNRLKYLVRNKTIIGLKYIII